MCGGGGGSWTPPHPNFFYTLSNIDKSSHLIFTSGKCLVYSWVQLENFQKTEAGSIIMPRHQIKLKFGRKNNGNRIVKKLKFSFWPFSKNWFSLKTEKVSSMYISKCCYTNFHDNCWGLSWTTFYGTELLIQTWTGLEKGVLI